MLRTPILILGGLGMLGQDLEKAFSDKDPIIWDRSEMDITDAETVKKKLAELKPGTVINAAAYNLVDDAEEEPGNSIAEKVNVEGPRNIAAACKEIDATFVHYSSDYVFAGDRQDGYQETDKPNPQSNYARSKANGEKAALESGARVFIVRTCKLFGQPGASAGSKKSFVDTMLDLAADRDQLDIVDEELASPTYTPDLAAHTRLLLEGDYDPGIYHITNSGSCTWYVFAKEIFKQSKIDIQVNPVTGEAFPRPAARPKFSILLNTKLPPLRTWQEALAEYLERRTE